MGAFVRAAGIDDVTPGHGFVAEVNGKTLAVLMWTGRSTPSTILVSIEAARSEREISKGPVVTCPWHSWRYNVTTGTCVANPAANMAHYDVLVGGADVKVLV